MYCNHCGSELIPNAKFCNKCGQALNQPEQAKNSNFHNLTKCKSCGALIGKTAKACPQCGAKTPGQLVGEALQGIGCGMLFVPLLIIIIWFIVIINFIQ